MTTNDEDSTFVVRLVRGALPIVVCLLLLALGLGEPPFSPMTTIAVCATCAIILWFGWNSVRRNVLTKWIGALLGLYLALILGLSAFGLTMGVLLVLVGLPLAVYDLFFLAPSEGQSEHAPVDPPSL
jgi:hypothetical protein